MAIPMPVITPETATFWEGCNAGEVRYQRCEHCHVVQRVPRAMCSNCHEHALAWQRSSGLGAVLSFTTVKRPPPAFRERAPYVIAIVDMDEGFRLMVTMRDGREPRIGGRVRIVFREEAGQALPEAEVAP